jgi:hypothetical protein
MSPNSSAKHKVFVSYYHKDDEDFRNEFEERFGHLFISRSVREGEIDTDNSTEYIRRLIQSDHLRDTSVIIVLVGPHTYCRKHVDWEIAAAISSRVGGRSGLFGLALRTHPDYEETNYDKSITPQRLVDNHKSGYAKYYDWTENGSSIRKYIEDAFEARIVQAESVRNSREQMPRNLSCE